MKIYRVVNRMSGYCYGYCLGFKKAKNFCIQNFPYPKDHGWEIGGYVWGIVKIEQAPKLNSIEDW
jgi:hypothetical protein